MLPPPCASLVRRDLATSPLANAEDHIAYNRSIFEDSKYDFDQVYLKAHDANEMKQMRKTIVETNIVARQIRDDQKDDALWAAFREYLQNCVDALNLLDRNGLLHEWIDVDYYPRSPGPRIVFRIDENTLFEIIADDASGDRITFRQHATYPLHPNASFCGVVDHFKKDKPWQIGRYGYGQKEAYANLLGMGADLKNTMTGSEKQFVSQSVYTKKPNLISTRHHVDDFMTIQWTAFDIEHGLPPFVYEQTIHLGGICKAFSRLAIPGCMLFWNPENVREQWVSIKDGCESDGSWIAPARAFRPLLAVEMWSVDVGEEYHRLGHGVFSGGLLVTRNGNPFAQPTIVGFGWHGLTPENRTRNTVNQLHLKRELALIVTNPSTTVEKERARKWLRHLKEGDDPYTLSLVAWRGFWSDAFQSIDDGVSKFYHFMGFGDMDAVALVKKPKNEDGRKRLGVLRLLMQIPALGDASGSPTYRDQPFVLVDDDSIRNMRSDDILFPKLSVEELMSRTLDTLRKLAKGDGPCRVKEIVGTTPDQGTCRITTLSLKNVAFDPLEVWELLEETNPSRNSLAMYVALRAIASTKPESLIGTHTLVEVRYPHFLKDVCHHDEDTLYVLSRKESETNCPVEMARDVLVSLVGGATDHGSVSSLCDNITNLGQNKWKASTLDRSAIDALFAKDKAADDELLGLLKCTSEEIGRLWEKRARLSF